MAYSESEIEAKLEAICSRIEEGESLRSVLRDNGMPSSKTFYEWIDGDEIKRKRYARACEIRADAIFDEMFDIADDGSNDFMTIEKGDISYEVENKEVTNRSRLRIDTRKWALSKMNPKKYGDKIDVTSDGDKLGSDLSKLTAEQLLLLEQMQRTASNDA